jgi:hypothetical protein
MCKALENVEDLEWQEVKSQISSINKWRYSFMGGLAAIVALMGLMTIFVKRAIDNSDASTEALTELAKELAVFRQEVKPFIMAGPRFTPSDFDAKIEVFEARVEKKIDVMIKERVPSVEVTLALEKGDKEHLHNSKMIDSVERRVETLEKAFHNHIGIHLESKKGQ